MFTGIRLEMVPPLPQICYDDCQRINQTKTVCVAYFDYNAPNGFLVNRKSKKEPNSAY